MASIEQSRSAPPSVGRLIRGAGVAFGTSGVRALVSDLTDRVCAGFVQAFLSVMRERFEFDRVAVGWDLRPSSPRIAAAGIASIRAAGFDVECCGPLPTPALALHALAREIPAIMVTGSHIPFDRNGLKFYRPDGEIGKADEQAILSAEPPFREIRVTDLPASSGRAVDAYVERFLAFFPRSLLSGRRIGVYQHSSVSRDILVRILGELGAEAVPLGRTDAFVPIDTEAVTAEDAERGRVWAREHRLDAIVSTDGDGDRPLLGDEHGEWLRGDIVGLLCARHLGIDALAVPVSCNTAIERSGGFSEVVRTRIGSPHVIAAMAGLGNGSARTVAGFEANGGFLLASEAVSKHGTLQPLPTRDAVLPALAVLAAAFEAGIPVSALAASLPSRHTASDRLQDFPVECSQAAIARFQRNPATLLALAGLGQATAREIDNTDGLRLTTDGGEIVHLRPSGNAPELRCYGEAETPARAREIVDAVLAALAGDVAVTAGR